MKRYLRGHRSTAWELLEVLSTWMSHWLWTTFLINVQKVGDELWYLSHLLGISDLLMEINWKLWLKCSIRGYKSTTWEWLEVLSTWMRNWLWWALVLKLLADVSVMVAREVCLAPIAVADIKFVVISANEIAYKISRDWPNIAPPALQL